MQKIGVFVCWCGSNIAGTVDVAQVVEAVRRIPDVAYAIDYKLSLIHISEPTRPY